MDAGSTKDLLLIGLVMVTKGLLFAPGAVSAAAWRVTLALSPLGVASVHKTVMNCPAEFAEKLRLNTPPGPLPRLSTVAFGREVKAGALVSLSHACNRPCAENAPTNIWSVFCEVSAGTVI